MWHCFTAWLHVCACMHVCVLTKWPFVLPLIACCNVCHQTALWCGLYLENKPPMHTTIGRAESNRMHVTYCIGKTHTHVAHDLYFASNILKGYCVWTSLKHLTVNTPRLFLTFPKSQASFDWLCELRRTQRLQLNQPRSEYKQVGGWGLITAWSKSRTNLWFFLLVKLKACDSFSLNNE